jgi:hypothetical protein
MLYLHKNIIIAELQQTDNLLNVVDVTYKILT